MSVSLIQGALGSFEFELLGNVPREVLDEIDYFGHIAIIPGRLDPLQYGDGCLNGARYVGVVRRKKYADDGRTKLIQDDIRIEGVGLNFWLGDDDNKGYIFDPAVSFNNAPFSAVLDTVANGGLIPPTLTVGTIHPVNGTYSGQHQYQTPRAAVQYVCDTLSDNSSLSGTGNGRIVWRVNNDFSFDAGPERDMVVVDPVCIIMRKGSTQGEDMAIRSLPATLDMDIDMEDFATRVIMIAESDGQSLATGSADIDTIAPGTNVFKDRFGNPLNLTKLVSESDTIEQWADVRAELALREVLDVNRQLTLNAEDFDIHGSFEVGDYVWVYDPDGGLVDPNNEVYIRGVKINPIKLRVTETDFPVTPGYTVAYRNVDGDWFDLTDYVHWEEGQPSKIVVGDFARTLTGNSSESVSLRKGLLVGTDTTTPDVPDFVTPFTTSGYETGDSLRSLAIVEWTTPSNTDLTFVSDGNLYEIGFKLDSETDWETRLVGWGTNTLLLQDLAPNAGYDFRIRATDVNGNQSAWSVVYNQSTSATASTPAAPVISGITSDSGEDETGTLKAMASVTWSIPLNEDGSPVVDGLSYEVEYQNGSSSATAWSSTTVPWGTNSTVIPGLDPGTSYNFKVRASDTAGNLGAFSTVVPHTTASSPSIPGQVVLSVPTSDSSEDNTGNLKATASLSWSQPLNTDGSAIIDGASYEVQFKKNSDANWQSQTVGWGVTNTLVTNLLPGTSYNFQVRAIDNSGHPGNFSTVRTITTSSVPSVPGIPTFTTPFATASYETNQGTKAQILVVWTTPLNTDSSTIIDGAFYEIQYRLSPQSNWDSRTVAWGTNQSLFSDLLPNTSYDFRIRAVDTAGHVGAFSTFVSRVTGNSPTIPGAPSWTFASFTYGSYQDGNGFAKASATVIWTTPTNTDASAIVDGDHYELSIRRNGDTDWTIYNVPFGTNSYRFLDLSVSTTYQVRIRVMDIGGNFGSYSATQNFTTTGDTVAPSTPAAPTVAAGLVSVQISHTLGKASGGTYNLEADLAYLEVHQGSTSGFATSSSTLIGKLEATKANLITAVPMVKSFAVSSTANQWYKVIAVDQTGNKSSASVGASATAQLIDDQHISDLTVSKVTAGTISANWLLASAIRTAATGARVELNSTGFQAYDSTGANTVNISNSGTFALESPPSQAATPVIEWVGVSPVWNDTTSATGFTLFKPAAVAVGDLLIAFLTTSANVGATTTPPTGWSLVQTVGADSTSDTELVVMKKTFAEGDPSAWTDGVTTAAVGRQSVVIAYRGADIAANQFVGTPGTATATATSTLAVTASNSNASAWRIAAWASQDDTQGGSWSSNASADRLTAEVAAGTNGLAMLVADSDGPVATGAATLTGTFTPGSGGTNFITAAAWMAYIKPLPSSQSRLEMDYQGIRAYNQVNTKTLDIASARGTIDLQGSVSSLNYLEGTDGWRIDGSGNTQFATLNVINDMGARDGYFRTLYSEGIAIPTQEVLDAHYQVPFPAGRVHATGTGTFSLTTSWKRLTYSYIEHERNCVAGSIWSSSVNSGRIYAPVEGIYQLSFNFVFNNGGGSNHTAVVTQARLNSGGSESGGYKIGYVTSYAGGAGWVTTATRTTVHMEAGDYIEIFSILGDGTANPSTSQFGSGDGQGCVDFSMIASTTGMGLDANATQTLPGGGTDGSGGGGTGAGGTHTKSWSAIDSTTFNGNNSIRTDTGKHCYQGYFDSTHGNQKSMVKFDFADIQSTLLGKTVTSCKLTFKVMHAYESGAFDAVIGTHGATSIASWTGTSDRVRRNNCTIGATYTVELGTTIGDEFKSGASKGIVFGPGPSTSAVNYYGYLYGWENGGSGRPVLTIEYQD
jgi:chitodextrinase